MESLDGVELAVDVDSDFVPSLFELAESLDFDGSGELSDFGFLLP